MQIVGLRFDSIACRFPEASLTPKFHVLVYEHSRMLKEHYFCGMMTEEVNLAEITG
jgi:hypothetical protein